MSTSSLRLATKLWLAVGIAVAAMLSLVALTTLRSTSLQTESEVTLGQIDAASRAATRWLSLTEINVTRVQATAISSDAALSTAFKDSIAATLHEVFQVQKILEGMALPGEHRKALQAMVAQQKGAVDSIARVREFKERFDHDGARGEVEKTFDPLAKTYLRALREFADAQEARDKAAREEFAEARRSTVLVTQVVIALLVAGLVAGAALLIRSIRSPLVEAVRLAGHVAKGDLRVRVAVQRGDEFGELMRDLQQTVERLNTMVREIKTTSDSVGAAAREISQGHSDLSTRTEEQASSLEETAAAMEEMTATVSQNAENARKASQLAMGASEVASKGGQAVGAVVATMSGISESSKKIADIIGVIDGIAFQTNILALNAAVEAARAGEQGRGFAVVASEVRNLAQRSAGAAKEIRQLISDSVGRIEAGSRQVESAGETMAEIVSAVKRVTDLIAEISAASQEQSQSLSQVSDTVQQLEKVTQQNAAMVEEATAASGSLEEQAGALMRAVGGFKLAEEGMTTTAPTPTPRAMPPQRVSQAKPELKGPRKRIPGGKDKGGEGWEEF